MRKKRESNTNLPEKANKILNGIVIVFILIVFKVWHLAVLQHDKKQEEASKPQRRIVIEKSERATICDRFEIPMAMNKVQYNAAISYGPIRDLPRWIWKKNEEGRRSKYFYRKEYIGSLANKLGEELHIDAERIEDLIHSKAAILGNVPCVIKENISEEEYFRLKMLEKDWPGIHAEIAAKRCYPLGKVGGEVIGYIGPISRKEYDSITQEMKSLRDALAAYEEGEQGVEREEFLALEKMRFRLEELEKKAYHINDYVGKTGIEAAFDEELRGLRGKRIYLSDIRGNFLRELEGSEKPSPGKKLVLTLSSELQDYAEQLLAEYDSSAPSSRPSALKMQELIPENQPWMKGGAIVALDPLTGEIYAMASFPRFDPNDFIRIGDADEVAAKNRLVNRWLETEQYLGNLWDLKEKYTRQRFDSTRKAYFDEEIELNWENYLSFVLPKRSEVRETLQSKNLVFDAVWLQIKVEELLSLFLSEAYPLSASKIFDFVYSDSNHRSTGSVMTIPEKQFLQTRAEEVQERVDVLKQELSLYFDNLELNYEKLLLTDLYRIAVDGNPFLIHDFKHMTIAEYREASARMISVMEAVRAIVQDLFREHDFKRWREEEFQTFLAVKRQEEKEKNQYARPYIDYLDNMHQELFEASWERYKWDYLLLLLTGKCDVSEESLLPYLSAISAWSDELRSGAHKGLSWVYHYNILREKISAFDRDALLPFLQSLRSFKDLNRPLLGKYTGLKGSKERNLAMAFYPTYGFGFARSHAFRQATTIGSIFKIVPAYEALRQRYLTLKERGSIFQNLNPLTIVDDKHKIWGANGGWNVGYTVDGRPIPMYYRGGRLPRTEHPGVGKVDLPRALEVSSNPYFALLAGDVLEDPEDLCKAANLLGYGEKTGVDLPGEYAGRIPLDVAYNRTGLYAMSIGQHSLVGTPLQTATMLAVLGNQGELLKPQIIHAKVTEETRENTEKCVRWKVFMPPEIKELLIKGLKQVVTGEKGTARYLKNQFDPTLVSSIVGKTSTAEVVEKMSLDGVSGRLKLKHVWFGGISYASPDFSQPELIVVVYLRYGDWGWKDAAPLAVEIVKKWREIKKAHRMNNSSYTERRK